MSVYKLRFTVGGNNHLQTDQLTKWRVDCANEWRHLTRTACVISCKALVFKNPAFVKTRYVLCDFMMVLAR